MTDADTSPGPWGTDWRLVPAEATEPMLRALMQVGPDTPFDRDGALDLWRDMMYVAPHYVPGVSVRDALAVAPRRETAMADDIELPERLRSVQPLRSGQVTRRVGVALEAMDAAVVAAITEAKRADVPQGLIVAILHAHAYQQTAAMVDASPDGEPAR